MNPVDDVPWKFLRNGGVAAIPTDTVYGLAANGLDEAAAARVFEVKGRPARNGLCRCFSRMRRRPLRCAVWTCRTPPAVLAKAFWPGSADPGAAPIADAVPDAR